MDKRALKEFLQKRYESPEAFLENVIFPVFGEENYDSFGNYHWLTKHPEDQTAAANAGIKDILVLGSIYVEGSQLDIFDITVASKRHLANNRVSIQSLIRRIISTYSGAFMIFHYQTSDRWDWRFSFCHKGASQLDSSDAKRYTFLLGPGQSCRTAAENFCKLGEKIANNGEFEMSDIIKAFDVEALSKEFFDKYKSQYEKFVSYMADEANGMRAAFIDTGFDRDGLSDEEIRSREEKPLRDYVKKLLGRIVFLHFIQKKGWLGVEPGKEWGEGDMDFMMNLYERANEAQQANFLDAVLEPLFEKGLNTDRSDNDDLFDTGVKALPNNGIVKIPYLNGGLFEREESDEPDTIFPAEYFKSLLTFFAQYNFTIDENDPNDAQVGIDPEMLGRIFENLLEDNKDKGAFYTPKEIVQYMCRESLIAYLQTDKDEAEKQAIRNFVTEYDITSLSESQKSEIDQKLKAVKICDPAIGSGAFPMGLLRELFLCRGVLENFNNAAEIKRHIIQKNIYGVDIEKGAVDIARLRFWLCLIVDEETPHALPNLDYKVMQGNSLLESYKGIDLSRLTAEKKTVTDGFQFSFYEDETDVQRRKLRNLLDDYYDCPNHAQKDEIRKQIAGCIQSQLDASGLSRQGRFGEELIDLSQINIAGNNQFFLWHTWFNDVFEQGGFDIVIGNPPYIEHKKLKYIASKLKQIFSVYSGTADFSVYFIEHGMNLLRAKGILSYITTNKFFNTGYGKPVRSLIALNDINILVNFEQVEVFEGILVSSVILNIRKAGAILHKSFTYERFYQLKSTEFRSAFSQKMNSFGSYSQDFLDENEWSFSNIDGLMLKYKVEKNATALENVSGVHIYRGVTTGFNPAFIINDELKNSLVAQDARSAELIKKMLQGRNIRKWYYNESEENLLQTGYDVDVQHRYPIVYAHLSAFENDLKIRSDQGVNWWNLRACKYYFEFECPEKVIWGLTANKWAFAYDDKQHYLPSNGYILTSTDIPIKYLLGWLNSKLMHHYFGYIGVMTAGGAYTLKATTISALPFKQPQDFSPVISLVDTILQAKAKDVEADTSKEEQAIDRYMYALYNLTPDEIDIVESDKE